MYSRDSLLLIGHGSTTQPGAARPLLAHADIVRESGRFGEVAVGMLHGEPSAGAAFDALKSSVVHVMPFFLEDGYFTRIAIPDLLLAQAGNGRVVRFCRPVGAHEAIADLFEARLSRHCDLFGTMPKSLAVILAAHGSARNPGRARALRRHAAKLEALDRYVTIRPAFLEESPTIAETLAGLRGHIVAVIGYFANEGAHATQDLPALISAERAARGTNWPPVHDLGNIGTDAEMPRLIIDQVASGQ